MFRGVFNELTLCVSVLLHVPDGVELVVVLVAHDLVLVEAPLRVHLAGKLQRLAGADVDQLDLRADRLPAKSLQSFISYAPTCSM
jgi:hypothetical protein